MPGYQPVRIMQPVEYFPKNESIYGQIKTKKKKSKGSHPLFDELKSRNLREKDYERFMRNGRDMVRTDPSGNKTDSLKFVASCNDLSYLDNAMTFQRQRSHEENEVKLRQRSLAKSSSTVFVKGGPNADKRNSIHNDTNAISAAMLNSLRTASSEDNLYESMEMIHYLKTKQTLDRQRKTRSVQKSGHPLFDFLRIEQALKEPCRKTSTSKKPFSDQAGQGLRSQEYTTSDGNSPSQSSSSSGDEYELYPRMVAKTSKVSRQKLMQQQQQQQQSGPHRRYSEPMHPSHYGLFPLRQEKQKPLPKKKRSDNNASDSDDELKIIPRPRLMSKGFLMQPQKPIRRRSEVSPPSDESDSSFNSALLR